MPTDPTSSSMNAINSFLNPYYLPINLNIKLSSLVSQHQSCLSHRIAIHCKIAPETSKLIKTINELENEIKTREDELKVYIKNVRNEEKCKSGSVVRKGWRKKARVMQEFIATKNRSHASNKNELSKLELEIISVENKLVELPRDIERVSNFIHELEQINSGELTHSSMLDEHISDTIDEFLNSVKTFINSKCYIHLSYMIIWILCVFDKLDFSKRVHEYTRDTIKQTLPLKMRKEKIALALIRKQAFDEPINMTHFESLYSFLYANKICSAISDEGVSLDSILNTYFLLPINLKDVENKVVTIAGEIEWQIKENIPQSFESFLSNAIIDEIFFFLVYNGLHITGGWLLSFMIDDWDSVTPKSSSIFESTLTIVNALFIILLHFEDKISAKKISMQSLPYLDEYIQHYESSNIFSAKYSLIFISIQIQSMAMLLVNFSDNSKSDFFDSLFSFSSLSFLYGIYVFEALAYIGKENLINKNYMAQSYMAQSGYIGMKNNGNVVFRKNNFIHPAMAEKNEIIAVSNIDVYVRENITWVPCNDFQHFQCPNKIKNLYMKLKIQMKHNPLQRALLHQRCSLLHDNYSYYCKIYQHIKNTPTLDNPKIQLYNTTKQSKINNRYRYTLSLAVIASRIQINHALLSVATLLIHSIFNINKKHYFLSFSFNSTLFTAVINKLKITRVDRIHPLVPLLSFSIFVLFPLYTPRFQSFFDGLITGKPEQDALLAMLLPMPLAAIFDKVKNYYFNNFQIINEPENSEISNLFNYMLPIYGMALLFYYSVASCYGLAGDLPFNFFNHFDQSEGEESDSVVVNIARQYEGFP